MKRAKRVGFGGFAWIVVAMLCVLPNYVSAQWILQAGQMDVKIRRGIDLVYNMEFDAAERTFDSVTSENPEHPAGYFYKAMVDFWRAVTNPDNTTYDDNYRAQLDVCLAKADSLLVQNERDLAGIFYKGAALGMRARIFAIRPTWQSAVSLMLRDAKEGVKYLDLIEEMIPSNSDVLFGRGLYNYYVEAVKEDHPLLRPIISLFATGNKRVGLQMLEKAAQDASYARTEARYELLKLYWSYEKNYSRAYAIAQFLTNKYPNNVVFLHHLGYAQHYYGLTEGYDSTYHVMLARAKEKREGYTIRQAREAMYFLGKAALLLPNRNLDSALYFLYNSNLLTRKISPDEETWWLAQSELLMGQAYDLKGMRSRAVEMYRRVLNLKEFSGSHTDAERYLKTPYKR
jgi:hypothetical protein